MTSELLSMIQFACLMVSGLMAAAVTLFVLWHSVRRPAMEEKAFFGVSKPHTALRESPILGPCERSAQDQTHALGLSSFASPSMTVTMPGYSGPARAAALPLEIFPVSTGDNADVTAAGQILVLQGRGDTDPGRAWLLHVVLPKLTAKGYEIVTAQDQAAAASA